MVNIFDIPEKTTINSSLSSKSIMVVGKSKSGKSTLAAHAPRPIFLMTENGGEALTGFTPVPISSWSEFKSAVNQLCSANARQKWDTVVIDTYTNLILLLDKYIGQKLTTDKNVLDFGSDADYGRGTKAMRNELGIQLQKLANQGYLLMNIVHAEDKTDFSTQRKYIGTSLSDSLYGVAEKFVDQIIYLRRDENKKGEIEHRIWFNSKGGFAGAGGRFTPKVDSIPCSFEDLKNTLEETIKEKCKTENVEEIVANGPSVTITTEDEREDFPTMMNEFKALTKELTDENPDNAEPIRNIIDKVLGVGKKVNSLTPNQSELLAEIISNIKEEFGE